MKKLQIKLFITVLLMTAANVYGDYSEPYSTLDETALEMVDDFIPADWKAIALAQGDLNKDGETDYALVIQDIDERNIRGSGGLVDEKIDANPRSLLVLFANADAEGGAAEQLSRKRIYRRFIPVLNPDFPDMAEPFSYIAINEGNLEVKFEVWATSGSWEKDHLTYKFRYQKKMDDFKLIAFDHRNVNRATAMFKDVTIDLVKQKMNKAAGSMSSPMHKKETLTFVAAQDWTPCSIKKPLAFYP